MSSTCSVTKSYVYMKINSVRWKPPASNFSKAELFVTGSWDNESNSVCLWQCENEGEPKLLQELPHAGDVTDITYISRNTLAVGSSNGSVSIYEHSSQPHQELTMNQSWQHCHKFSTGSTAPCTSLASEGSLVASVGEDAKLLLLYPGQQQPHRVIESGSDSSEYAVVFVKTTEVLTGSMQGQLRLWDIRKSGNTPVATMVTTEQEWVRRLSSHPSQQHVVAAAGEAGTLTLWDMRNTDQPFSCIAAHSAPMVEARFHSGAPDHLFSCGLDGQLVHWDTSCHAARAISEKHSGLVTSWLHPGVSRGDVATTALLSAGPLPLNSVDVQGDVLLAGSDNEAIYVIRNVILY